MGRGADLGDRGPRARRRQADGPPGGDDAVEALAKVTAELANGEQRPEQQEMCRAVGEALVTGTHLVVQAGTGTGKSLAYLVPPCSAARRWWWPPPPRRCRTSWPRRTCPWSTAGWPAVVLRGAQGPEQLHLPPAGGRGGERRIQPELGDGAGAARPSRVRAASPSRTAESAPGGLVDEVRTLLAWSETTVDRRPGRPELRAQRPGLGMVSVGPRECPGAFNCPSGNRCFAEAARDRAAAADVVVVNTHLYGAHLASGGPCCPSTTWSSSTRPTSSRR